MILLIDVGNTRVKWAALDAGQAGPQQAAVYRDWSAADWRRQLFASLRPTRVVGCSVASAATRASIDAAAADVTGRPAEWIVATAAAAGVTNGYRNPAQLGADRLGRHHRRAQHVGRRLLRRRRGHRDDDRHRHRRGPSRGRADRAGSDADDRLAARPDERPGRPARRRRAIRRVRRLPTRRATRSRTAASCAPAALVERACRSFGLRVGSGPRSCSRVALPGACGRGSRCRRTTCPTSCCADSPQSRTSRQLERSEKRSIHGVARGGL